MRKQRQRNLNKRGVIVMQELKEGGTKGFLYPPMSGGGEGATLV